MTRPLITVAFANDAPIYASEIATYKRDRENSIRAYRIRKRARLGLNWRRFISILASISVTSTGLWS